MQDQTSKTEQARAIGQEHGRRAAGWVFDGRTTDQTYRSVLKGIQDCDPLVMDAYLTPSLSGEFADEYSERDLAADLTSDECREQGHDATDHDDWDDAANAYNDAASESFWSEVERLARDHVLGVREQILRGAAGAFPIRYAARPEHSTVWCSDVRDYPGEDLEAYADLSSIGKGEDTADQSTTVDRSNFRSLIRDYPDVFTPLAWSNVDGLAAFVADLSDELADVLVALVEQYPLYDESDLSELESEEITASWEQYVRLDFPSELPSDVRDAWDALSPQDQEERFWAGVSSSEAYPEHSGLDVIWRYDAIAEYVASTLRESQS